MPIILIIGLSGLNNSANKKRYVPPQGIRPLRRLYKIILIPVVAPTIKKLKKIEGEDAYDQDISYGIFDVLKGNTWKYELIMMCQMAKEMNKPK